MVSLKFFNLPSLHAKAHTSFALSSIPSCKYNRPRFALKTPASIISGKSLANVRASSKYFLAFVISFNWKLVIKRIHLNKIYNTHTGACNTKIIKNQHYFRIRFSIEFKKYLQSFFKAFLGLLKGFQLHEQLSKPI